MNAIYQDEKKRNYQSYILSTPLISIDAAGIYDARITLDSSFSFESGFLSAYTTGDDITVDIEYNSNDKLTNGETHLKNIAMVNGEGDIRLFPIMVLPNSSIKMRIKNNGSSAASLQISFIGKRFVS